MDAGSPCLRRSLTLTQRLALSLTVGALLVALVLGFVGAARSTLEDEVRRAEAELDLATALAERSAPLLERSDLLRLSVLATVAHDQVKGRVLVLDRDGRVAIDTALVRGDRQIGLLAGSGPFQRTVTRVGAPDDEPRLLRETLIPIRFGGEVIGELRVECDLQVAGSAFDFGWFGLVLISCLTLVFVAVMMGHQWSSRVRRATDSLIELSSSAAREVQDAGAIEAGASPSDLQEIHGALREMERGIHEGMSQAASGFGALAQQLVDTLERARLAPPGHGARTARLAERLAKRLRIDADSLADLTLACGLVDLGKAWIRPAILQKQGALTDREAESLRQHPVRAADALETMPALRSVAQILRHQSECYDGSGIPDRLRGDRIPAGARMLRIASTFDLLTTCAAESPMQWEEALEHMHKARGEVFDPWLLEQFAEEIRLEPPVTVNDPPVMIVPAGFDSCREAHRIDDDDDDVALFDELEVLADDDPSEETKG